MDRRKPIIALDFNRSAVVFDFLRSFDQEKLNIKIGMELFYSNGPDIVMNLNDSNHDIFLDLKLHDIPNTVKKTMETLASLGVKMVNVHAQGGQDMMEAAREGLEKGTGPGQKRPLLIGVTQLTSLSKEDYTAMHGEERTLEESVIYFAQLAKKSGLDGVVCSPWEIRAIHEHVSQEFLTVTPGIRLKPNRQDDQNRIATPTKAAEWGSDYIVVGRPITQSINPSDSYLHIKNQWLKAIERGS